MTSEGGPQTDRSTGSVTVRDGVADDKGGTCVVASEPGRVKATSTPRKQTFKARLCGGRTHVPRLTAAKGTDVKCAPWAPVKVHVRVAATPVETRHLRPPQKSPLCPLSGQALRPSRKRRADPSQLAAFPAPEQEPLGAPCPSPTRGICHCRVTACSPTS